MKYTYYILYVLYNHQLLYNVQCTCRISDYILPCLVYLARRATLPIPPYSPLPSIPLPHFFKVPYLMPACHICQCEERFRDFTLDIS